MLTQLFNKVRNKLEYVFHDMPLKTGFHPAGSPIMKPVVRTVWNTCDFNNPTI